jgi:hypothetical protein
MIWKLATTEDTVDAEEKISVGAKLFPVSAVSSVVASLSS